MHWLIAGLKSWFEAAVYWIRRYGFLSGMKVAFQFRRGIRRKGIFALQLPDFIAPIWMRGQGVDHIVFYQVLQAREYDVSGPQAHALRKQYDALVSAGQQALIVDCGANIGLSSIWYAKEFPKAKIVAVEPDPSNLEIAAKNLAPYQNVDLIAGAVWDTPSKVGIINPGVDPWKFRVQEGDGSTAGVTMDQLSGGSPILIAKIDIEGAERELFRSNTEWIDRTDCIAIELHDWLFPGGGTSQPFITAMAKRPHEIALRGENLFFFIMHSTAQRTRLDGCQAQ